MLDLKLEQLSLVSDDKNIDKGNQGEKSELKFII